MTNTYIVALEERNLIHLCSMHPIKGKLIYTSDRIAFLFDEQIEGIGAFSVNIYSPDHFPALRFIIRSLDNFYNLTFSKNFDSFKGQ